MVTGTTTSRPFSQAKKEPLALKATTTVTACPPRRNGTTLHQPAKVLPDRRSLQSKLRGGLPGGYPHLENHVVVSNVGAPASTTPGATPLKFKVPKSVSVAEVDTLQGLSSTGSGGYLSRTSSNVSSVVATSEEGASSVSESDAEENNTNVEFSNAARRTELMSRRASLKPKVDNAGDLPKSTPTKSSRPAATAAAAAAAAAATTGRTLVPHCPSPARSVRSAGAQRTFVLQPLQEQPSLKSFELEENPSFWDYHNVQVVVRARPISGKEAAKQEWSRCLRQEGAHAITWQGPPETRFTFDHVAGENISQEKLFEVVGVPIVENCMVGYNSCMFAYGQTGSGKTHTMLGNISELGDRPSDNRGMTPRIFEFLFSRIQKEEKDRQQEQLRYMCKCSFLEIYNEQITDLLEPSSSNLQMREDSKKCVYVENLTEKVVTSVQDVISLLLKGTANRRVASTNMNRDSSRSHSVFTCSIECKWETNSLSNMRFGRLNLVDLAGSERQKSSGAEGGRLKEAASINKSLSTLGLVMMILVDIANGKQRHVPYRDSKLTFLLQDSLGGNSKTAIIATISPSSCCSMETLSTLKFAQRAKFIQNNAVINEDATGEMHALRLEIQQLKKNDTDVKTIRHLNATVERLQTELQRKEDLLYGLEFDVSLLQEHAAEDTDFKQELLKAKSRVYELQAEAKTRSEELKQLGFAKKDVEEQLALKTEAMMRVEEAMIKSGTHAAQVMKECQALNSTVSQLQTRLHTLEGALAERTEALISQQGDVEGLVAERDALKSQCSNLELTVETLESSIAHQVDDLHGELLVSMMMELCWQDQNSDAEMSCFNSRLGEVTLQKAVIEEELRTARATQSTLECEIQGLTHRLAACQASNEALDLELAEQISKLVSFKDDLNIESKCMKTEMRALFKERDDLKIEIGKRSTTISFLESDLIMARASAEASSEAFAALETKVGTLQAQIVEARKVTESFVEENSDLYAQVVELQQELSCKIALTESLETQLSSSSTTVRVELTSFEAQILELQSLKLALEREVAGKQESISCQAQENSELRVQMETWQQKCWSLEPQLATTKAQVAQQEVQLSSLEELLDRAEAEVLQLMVNSKPNHARDEIESSRSKITESKESENNEEIQTLKEARDDALAELQALTDTHRASILENSENIQKLETLVSTQQNQNSVLEKQIEVMKLEANDIEQARDGLEMELQGMKNRLTMIQASRDVKGLHAAQAANVDLQRRLEEKETEVSQLYLRMASMQSQIEDQTSWFDDKASELAHAHQEIDDLQYQCEDKDAQLLKLKELNRESEKLTQDVMRDLHNMKFDVSNYASLVNQQKVELISQRGRHSDEVREKDDEISILQTQLNQERHTWMLQMNHKQTEMVVARALSEKMRLKNKNLSAECKKLKADCSGKKRKLKILEQQLKELSVYSRRVSTESEADFNEVQQFLAIRAHHTDSETDFDEVEQFQALLAQANGAQRQECQVMYR